MGFQRLLLALQELSTNFYSNTLVVWTQVGPTSFNSHFIFFGIVHKAVQTYRLVQTYIKLQRSVTVDTPTQWVNWRDPSKFKEMTDSTEGLDKVFSS